MPELVVATVVHSSLEAQLVVGLLEANGVQAVISADDAGGQNPALVITNGVRVLVHSADLEAAQELIADPPTEDSVTVG